jgi:hypothetical protein
MMLDFALAHAPVTLLGVTLLAVAAYLVARVLRRGRPRR